MQLGVNATEINTKSGDLNLKSFTNIINLENNVIISNNLRVAGLSTFAQVVTANNGILPTSDLGSFIGSATTAFGNAHIGNVNIASGENNTISTKSGDLKLTSNTNITRVLKKLIVDELSELTGIASVGTGIIPTSDKSGYLGSSSYAFETAHINNIRIAVASTSTIDTISGDLVLQSNSNYVQVNDNLVVGGGLTVTNNVSAGPLFVNSSNNRIGVGTTSPETNFDVISTDDNVSVLIKTSDINNFPTLTLTSGTSSANIIFNELQDRTLKIRNQTPGPIVYQLHSGAAGVGTGNHTWKYKDTDLMSLTYGGKLGVGKTDPLETFEVVGTSTVTSNSFVGGDLKVAGDVTIDGDLIVDFGTNLNLNVGIVTANSLISINSITSGSDLYVNRELHVNNLSNRTVGNGITFNSSSRFNFTADHYDNVNIHSGYDLNVNDNGSITVRSGSGVGTASTIASDFIYSNNFYSNLFDGAQLTADSAQVGIITVTNFEVTGISTVSFYDLTANSLTIDSNSGVFIGQPVSEDGVENFVGIGTTQKIGGVSLYSSGTVLSPKFVAGITTITQNTNFATATVAILSGNLLLDDGDIVINNGGNISIGNSSPSTEICSINDSFGKTIIGIGTTSAKAVIDFSNAGSGISTSVTPVGLGSQMRFMIPPSITSSERVGLATVEGAFIFNKSTKKHQMYDGTTWHDMY